MPQEEAVVKEASPKLDDVRKEAASVSPRPGREADVADHCALQLPWLQPPWLQPPWLPLPLLRCGDADGEAEGDAHAQPCMYGDGGLLGTHEPGLELDRRILAMHCCHICLMLCSCSGLTRKKSAPEKRQRWIRPISPSVEIMMTATWSPSSRRTIGSSVSPRMSGMITSIITTWKSRLVCSSSIAACEVSTSSTWKVTEGCRLLKTRSSVWIACCWNGWSSTTSTESVIGAMSEAFSTSACTRSRSSRTSCQLHATGSFQLRVGASGPRSLASEMSARSLSERFAGSLNECRLVRLVAATGALTSCPKPVIRDGDSRALPAGCWLLSAEPAKLLEIQLSVGSGDAAGLSSASPASEGAGRGAAAIESAAAGMTCVGSSKLGWQLRWNATIHYKPIKFFGGHLLTLATGKQVY